MMRRIDSLPSAAHQQPVLTLLRHLLCLGLLLGLAGNGLAAAAPCILMPQEQSVVMAAVPDCQMDGCTDCRAKDMAGDKAGKDKASGCLAMAACAAVVAMKDPAESASLRLQTNLSAFWPATDHLAGRDVAPEPEPPALLG